MRHYRSRMPRGVILNVNVMHFFTPFLGSFHSVKSHTVVSAMLVINVIIKLIIKFITNLNPLFSTI